MSDRSQELVRKAVQALSTAEREDLLVELLLRGPQPPVTPSSSTGPTPDPAAEDSDVEYLAATLGEPLDITAPLAAMKVLPIRLPETTHDRLRRFSHSSGFSMAVVIRTLVERFLDSQPTNQPDSQLGAHPGAAPTGPRP